MSLRAKLVVVLYGAAAALGLAALAGRLAAPGAIQGSDFTAFWTGWWMILHGRGHDLYDVAAQQVAQRALLGGRAFPGGLLAFLQPPHAALAGVPLGLIADRFGEAAAFRVWTTVNLGLAALLARDLGRLSEPAPSPRRLLVAVTLFAFFPLFLCLREGQLSLLLAVAALRLYCAVRDEHDGAAAGWLLVLSIKPQLLLLPVALLATRRRTRALGLAALGGAVAALGAMASLGAGTFVSYARNLRALESHFGRGSPAGMPNARGLFTLAFGDRRALVETLTIVVWGLAAVALAARWARRRGHESWESAFATCLAATLIVTPHLFVQDLVLWAVALALAVATVGLASNAGGRWARFALVSARALPRRAGRRRRAPRPGVGPARRRDRGRDAAASALAGVVDGAAAAGELAEGVDGLVAQNAVGDGDAALAELVGPVRVDRPLVEAGDQLQLGAAARDDDVADARPADRAAAHRAGAPVDDQLVRRLAGAPEIVGAAGPLGQRQRHHLGVRRRAPHRHDAVDADRDQAPAVALEHPRRERAAGVAAEVRARKLDHPAHALLDRAELRGGAAECLFSPVGEAQIETKRRDPHIHRHLLYATERRLVFSERAVLGK